MIHKQGNVLEAAHPWGGRLLTRTFDIGVSVDWNEWLLEPVLVLLASL
jgi:hypothetical protein